MRAAIVRTIATAKTVQNVPRCWVSIVCATMVDDGQIFKRMSRAREKSCSLRRRPSKT
jgi:hypothetical protein